VSHVVKPTVGFSDSSFMNKSKGLTLALKNRAADPEGRAV